MPFYQWRTQCLGDLVSQHGFAGAGFALDQERSLQCYSGVDAGIKFFGGDVRFGSLETQDISPVMRVCAAA